MSVNRLWIDGILNYIKASLCSSVNVLVWSFKVAKVCIIVRLPVYEELFWNS